MNFKTSLISGAGNTFHITWKNPLTEKLMQQKVSEEICMKNKADGFIFLNYLDDKKLFVWDFYNNDGSVAEMCGNATRCVGYFIKNILKSEFNTYPLMTTAGLIQIESLSSEKYKIQMTEILPLQSTTQFYCDTGVPHIVIEFKDFDNYKNYKEFCKNLRFDSEFQPRGTNVTLILKTDTADYIKAVSYERGVEDFTNACGTGAMAAAYYNFIKFKQTVTTIEMPGGQLLMDLTDLKKPLMTGPAILLGDFIYDEKI